MKKLLNALIFSAFALGLAAQDPEPYQFKEFKTVPCTPVKNQQKTGTCWCFSTLSFLESELLRMGKGEHNLSEMFAVRHVYRQKCEQYVRRQGHEQLGEGGLAHDLLNAVRDFGIVPEDIYPGRKDVGQPYDHSKLEKTLIELCKGFVEQGKKGELPADWLAQIEAVLDAEFGPVPRKFSIAGQPFTPLQYADYLGIKPSDYVSITSFTHRPFWSSFILEVPDNFSHGSFYNLPLDDMMRCLNFSIQQGYSVEWDADVSNAGFGAKYGLALVPEKDWKDKSEVQRANTFKYTEPEKLVSQDYRQQLFDRQETTDDHLMHITGILDETHNGLFYKVKNSWGEVSDMKGFVYCSEAYMRQNTISFTVHKDALPTDVRRRLGLEAGPVNIEQPSGPGMRKPASSSEATPSPATGEPRPGKVQPRFKTTPATPAPKPAPKQ